MENFNKLFLVVTILVHTSPTKGTSRSSAYRLRNELFRNYSNEIRPVEDCNESMNISTQILLSALVDLDEPSGQLATMLTMTLRWMDVGLTWNPDEYEGHERMEVNYNRVWTPSLLVINPSKDSNRIGSNEGTRITVSSSGVATWLMDGIFYTTCNVDITYFPFDKQVCHIKFAISEYGDLVRFALRSPTIDLTHYTENGIWILEKTKLTNKFQNEIFHELWCTLHLKRRSTFYTLSILTPLAILVLLNCMVFLLPAESGERVGFAVTILLSTAVFMTIIADSLPNTSKPASLLTYMLTIYVAQSATICIETLFSLRIHMEHNSKRVPKFHIYLVHALTCKNKIHNGSGQRKENKGIDDDDDDDARENRRTEKDNESDYSGALGNTHITWVYVAKIFDKTFFVFNIVLCFFIAIVYVALVFLHIVSNDVDSAQNY